MAFKQYSLRNPVVEQIVTETLRVVRDIWKYYGNGKERYFNEIHVELGREMKNPADERKRITKGVTQNQKTNQRINAILSELKNQDIEGVIPYSPNQLEKLRIFEQDVLNRYSEKELKAEIYDGVSIAEISKSATPSRAEIEKYSLWLEQKYRSPYTGQVIPLSKLFTTEYEIEHIIPQARYFDNSLGNKVICETEVNKFKGNQTAFEMIVYPGYTNTLFDSMAKNLINNKNLYNFIYKIVVNNQHKPYTINNPNILLATAYGIIRDNRKCIIHNPIFQQRIYDLMLSIHQDNSDDTVLSLSPKYYKGKDIDLDYILRRFQTFFKEHYSHKDDRFIEREGRLIFLSYLQPIINGDGYVFKEAVVGEDRRMDLVITHNNKRYVIELKIWRGEAYHQEGLEQLNDYLDTYSLKTGYLLIFNFNKKKEYKEDIIKYKDKELFTVWT